MVQINFYFSNYPSRNFLSALCIKAVTNSTSNSTKYRTNIISKYSWKLSSNTAIILHAAFVFLKRPAKSLLNMKLKKLMKPYNTWMETVSFISSQSAVIQLGSLIKTVSLYSKTLNTPLFFFFSVYFSIGNLYSCKYLLLAETRFT